MLLSLCDDALTVLADLLGPCNLSAVCRRLHSLLVYRHVKWTTATMHDYKKLPLVRSACVLTYLRTVYGVPEIQHCVNLSKLTLRVRTNWNDYCPALGLFVRRGRVEENLNTILRVLLSLPKMTCLSLELESMDLTDKECLPLITGLATIKNLKSFTLHLRNNNLTSAFTAKLGALLRGLPDLMTFDCDLSLNCLDDTTLRNLFCGTGRAVKIQLKNNSISDAALLMLPCDIATTRLQSLSLDVSSPWLRARARITASGIQSLVSHILNKALHLTTLTLCLERQSIGPQGVHLLSAWLRGASGLQHLGLYLRSNDVGRRALVSIFNTIPEGLRSLQLGLQDCHLTTGLPLQVCHSLDRMVSLRHVTLLLDGNRFCEYGLCQLISTFGAMPLLHSFVLSLARTGANFHRTSVRIAQLLNRVQTAHVNLGDNGLYFQSALQLITSLGTFFTGKELVVDFRHNGWSVHGRDLVATLARRHGIVALV
jgi:hypothetical protein